MSPEQIAGLQPGPALDLIVHQHIFGSVGRRRAYSTTPAAFDILKVLPSVAVGRGNPEEANHNPAKPYWAGIVEQMADDEGGARYTTMLRLFSATPEIALCKVGLMKVFQCKAVAE